MMSMKKKIGIHYLKYTIKKEDSGQEVRSILYEKMKLTTRKIRDLKRNTQGILLNGEPVTVRKTVREGSILQVILNDSQGGCGQNHILPVSMHLCILYEDEDLLFVNKSAGIALCQVTIETGRTHQIRFHMASIGCPLLGDTLYGDEFQNETKMKRTALHARKVTFPHPFTGEEISITAALPDDMKNAINVMKKGEKNASTRN